MDNFFKFSQFKINRFLLISTGLWPLKINWQQKLCFSLLIFLVFCQTFLQVGTVIVASKEGDIVVLLEASLNIFIDSMIISFIILWLIKFTTIKQIFKNIYWTWHYFLPEERTILEKYANKSRKITVTFAWSLYGILIPYMVFLLYPILTKSFPQKNEKTMQLLYPVKHFLNIQNYYYCIVAMTYFGTLAIISAFVVFDTVIVIFIQHACGMFTILMQRLQNITGNSDSFDQHNAYKNQDKSCEIAIKCLAVHKIIIEFSDQVNSAFSLALLISIISTTVLISFTAFCAREYRHTSSIMVRYMILTLVEICQLFHKFWQCQTLIDHSTLFRNSIYDSNWYKASLKTKKILYFMLLKSENVCKLTGGKFFDMSYHTFVKILSSAVSYFTVLSTIK